MKTLKGSANSFIKSESFLRARDLGLGLKRAESQEKTEDDTQGRCPAGANGRKR